MSLAARRLRPRGRLLNDQGRRALRLFALVTGALALVAIVRAAAAANGAP